MSVLVIADIINNELSIDLTGKTVNAVTDLGEVTILCASDDAKNASIEASKIKGVNSVPVSYTHLTLPTIAKV